MKLVGKAYCWRKDTHIDYRCWFVLKDLFRALNAPHLLYSSEEDYNEPTVADEPEPAVEPESDPTIIDEPEPNPEIEKLLIEIPTDLPVNGVSVIYASCESSYPLRLPDVYDPLPILLEATG